MNLTVALIIVSSVAFIALVLGIVSLSLKRTEVQKRIVIQDDEISMKDGIVYAKGFSNEPYKTNKQVSAISKNQVTSALITDGLSTMQEGNLHVKYNIESKRFSDGTLTVEAGDLTTSGHISTDKLTVNRVLSMPAHNYAQIFILGMNPVNFSEQQEWKPISEQTKNTQLFFPSGLNKLHHNVTIQKGNKIQLHQEGRWMYQFSCVVSAQDDVLVGMTLSEKRPQLSHGYASHYVKTQENSIIQPKDTTEQFVITGNGILAVEHTDSLFNLWFSHTSKLGDNLELTFVDGTVSLLHIGT